MSDFITTLVTKLSQPFPSFDSKTKAWFRSNLWIISLVMAIIAGLNALRLLGNFLNTLRAMGVYMDYYNGGMVGFLRLHLVVSMLLAIGMAILLGLATAGLKQQKRVGWFLLVLALLISTGFAIVGVLLDVVLAPALIVTSFVTLLVGLAMLYVAGQVSDQFTKR